MPRTTQFVIWVAGLSLSAAVAAQQAAPPAAKSDAPASTEQETLQPKIAPLLLAILSGVASEFSKQVGAGAGKDFMGKNPGLFSSLMQRLGWGGKSDLTAADATSSGEHGLAPAVGYALQKLDPVSFDVVTALEVGEAPTVLKTGDVFAIQYSTNLPGQIRLENVDPMGRVNNLGTYTVRVDQLNRLPRDRGIRLEGEPGIELLKLYFYPCLPPEAAGQPWGARFESQLPSCGSTQNNQVAAAASGAVKTRSLVNLSQPDATMAFAGVAEYRMNEVTLAIVQIKHERPGDGR